VLRDQGRWLLLFILIGMQSACVSNLWTGASIAYDRHSWYKTLGDYELTNQVERALYQDNALKEPDCHVELAVFNRDILLAGTVDSMPKRALAEARARQAAGSHATIYNQLSVNTHHDSAQFTDSWITTKIRSGIFADASIPPKVFKIVTVDGTVFIMGHVKTAHAEKVVDIARDTEGVKKIVKLMKYYQLAS